MKTKLFTQKSFLVMLMTLVLAFSVPSLADALTFSTSRSGDLETKQPNETFRITFSVSLKGNTAIKDSNGDLVTEDGTTKIDSSGYQLDDNGNRVNTLAAGGAGNIPIDSSGFKLDSAGKRVTVHIDKDNDNVVDSGETYYTLVKGSDDSEVTVDSSRYEVDGSTGVRTGTSPVTPAKQFKVSDAVRYHYNSEAIGIDFAGPARIIRVGSRDVNIAADAGATPDGTANLAMYERSHASYNTAAEHQKLSGSVTLVLEPTGVAGGVVTVKVTDETPTTDAPTNGKSSPITFTLYSVKYQSNISQTNSVTTLNGDSVEYAFDNDERPLGSYFTFVANAEVPVHYSIDGSGTLSISETYTDGSPTSVKTASKTLSTSSSAPVFIDMKRGTNKVTAWVSGGASKIVIFIYQGSSPTKYPEIEITGDGNGQTGAIQGRLEEPLAVKVTDGNNRPISGVTVGFTTTSGTNSMFIPVPGTRVWGSGTTLTPTAPTTNLVDTGSGTISGTTIATSNTPNAGASIFVKTDRNGVAQTYYQLGNTTGAYQVTATLQGILAGQVPTVEVFDATAVSGSRSASLVIVSGDNQRSDTATHDIEDPLVVRVRRPGGYRISNVIIRFTGLIGALEAAPGTKYVHNDDVAKLPSARQGYTATGVTETDNNAIKGSVSGQEIFVLTNAHGEASVTYNAGQIAGAKTVTARINDEEANSQYDFQIRQVVFNIDGSGTSQQNQTNNQTNNQTTTTPTLTVGQTSITGQPGSTQQLPITASQTAQVGNFLDRFLEAGGSVSPSSSSGSFTANLILPSAEGTYPLTVSMGGITRTVTVTVSRTAAAVTPTGSTVRIRSITPPSGAPGTQATVTVQTTDADGDPASDVSASLSITSGGGTLNPSSVTTNANGIAVSILTFGSTPGSNYFITASADGYTFDGPTSGERVTITGTQPAAGGQPAADDTPSSAAGEPDGIDVYDGNNQRGILNSQLSEPLIVEVVDANDDPVSNERVTFRTTIGEGRFRPARPRTDEDGRAETLFTPTSSGRIRISASVTGIASRAVFTITTGEPPASITKVSGDSQSGSPGNALANPFVVEVKDADGEAVEGVTVTFSVTAGGGSLSETSATTDDAGRASTTLTLGRRAGINSVEAAVSGVAPVTFSTSVDAKILVAAANRPVMYWIASGDLYRLAGAKEAKIAENVNAAAIGGNKLYWTIQTGPSAGTVHSANLDGTGVTQVAKIRAVPIGIAVDTANSKLYWTNSRGRVQSAALNGSGIKNVVQNRSGATDIAIGGGSIYWVQNGTSIHRVPIQGRKVVADVATGLSSVGGIAVSGTKVYWTEAARTGGTINGADLDGTNFKTLKTIQAVPIGIAVDTAGSQLYWTNSIGRVQRANLNASRIQNVVDGLIAPGQLLIGGANTPTTATQPAKKPATTAPKGKYDINGDGTVDSKDTGLLVLAISTGDTSAKYDVNGDGNVNFSDYVLVSENITDGAAGAPSVFGIKMTAEQIERLQEQIDLLIASGDRSPAAMRALIYFQQLIATARPEKTQLLANYPNPFNPETWIPYELATDTDVRITIYNAQGVVIRTLQLGQQSAGYYTDRERAAYWDGRNALGEQVASGIYFYQLETDEMSSLRKMVILK